MPYGGADLRQAITLALQLEGQGIGREAAGEFDTTQIAVTQLGTASNLSADSQAKLEKAMIAATTAATGAARATREHAEAVEALATASTRAASATEASGKAGGDAASATATKVKASVDKQIDDYGRLQAKLKEMDARDHEGRADDARAQQLREEAELQEYLRKKTEETTSAAVRGERETITARDRGTQAVRDEVEANRLLEAAELRVHQAATKDANARTWLDKQQADLDAVLRDLHEYEQVAETVQVSAGAAGVRAGRAFGDGLDKGIDAARAGAKSRLGLGIANMLQDTIQGGNPAFAINNILGLAGDKGVKSLVGEGIAAAGGIKAIATAFGTVAIAAGSAFLVIDGGLKQAKLDWSDFGTVVGNLDPIHAAGEALSGLGTIVTDVYDQFSKTTIGAGAIAFVSSIGTSISAAVGFIDEYTLGWGRATDAAKVHKDELEMGARAARDYAEAVKNLSKYQSEAQEKKAEIGGRIGKELAELGGENGIEGLADRISRQLTKVGGDQKVTVQEADAKGNISDVEVTRREMVRRRVMDDLNRSLVGDPNAIGRLSGQIRGAGLDPSKLMEAAQGVDRKSAAKEAADKLEGELQEADALREEWGRGPERRRKQRQEIASSAREVGPGFDDALIDKLFGVAKAGGNVGAAAAGERAGLVSGLGGRVKPGQVEAVADAIIAKATVTALNAVQSGEVPKLQRDRDAAAKKRTDDLVSRYQFEGIEESELYDRRRRGQGAAQANADSLASIREGLATKLNAQGPEADAAAARILTKVADAVERHLAEGTMPTNLKREVDARKGEVGRIDDGFMGPVGAAVLRNELAKLTGDDSAVHPEALAQELRNRVGFDLQSTGQDPGLAGEIVQRGFERAQDLATQAMATSANAVEALSRALGSIEAKGGGAAGRGGGAVGGVRRQARPAGGGGGFRSVVPDGPDDGGPPVPKSQGPAPRTELALEAMNRELAAALQQAHGRLARLEGLAQNMAVKLRMVRTDQGRVANRLPSLSHAVPWV